MSQPCLHHFETLRAMYKAFREEGPVSISVSKAQAAAYQQALAALRREDAAWWHVKLRLEVFMSEGATRPGVKVIMLEQDRNYPGRSSCKPAVERHEFSPPSTISESEARVMALSGFERAKRDYGFVENGTIWHPPVGLFARFAEAKNGPVNERGEPIRWSQAQCCTWPDGYTGDGRVRDEDDPRVRAASPASLAVEPTNEVLEMLNDPERGSEAAIRRLLSGRGARE